MHRKPSAKTSRAGVTHTQLAIEENLGWLFREQPTEDYGIDAHAEVVDGEDVQGRLLALQIKGGNSWFDEPAPGGWWFRPDSDHVEYWTNHSLPVAIVLHRPKTGLCHWQLVDRENLVETRSGGWKVLIPESQVLDQESIDPLREAAEGDPYELRLRDLRLAKPWMERLQSGARLVVDFDAWVNKMSHRGTVSIGVDHEDGDDPEELVTWQFWIGPSNYAEAVPKLFAWADAEVHEETYDHAEYEQFESECTIWDEGDRFLTEDYVNWRRTRIERGIRPYNNSAGEVDHYRVELKLNELGHAFLVVDRWATEGERLLTT